jgi:hypothetical protein
MILLKDLIKESKQSIINLGFPEIIAKLFYEKFGNKAFVLSRWYKDYYDSGRRNKDWWDNLHSRSGEISLFDLIKLYYSTSNPEEYLKTLNNLELSHEDFDLNYNDPSYLKKQREIIKKEIEKKFFDDTFFTWYQITKDVISGKLKDIKPYENMKFTDASLKYDERRIFSEMKPIKVYRNGFKWIDVGKRCHLMSHFMKNCGSAGVMGVDKDRTMIGLFDVNNKPHVVVTYHPNEKRISGDESVASSETKPEYHKYVLDLAKVLGSEFDAGRTKSKLLMLKYMLKNKATNIKKIKAGKSDVLFQEYFKFNIGDKDYYSDGFDIVSGDDVRKSSELVKTGVVKLKYNLRNQIRNVFNFYNKQILSSFGINYVYVRQFVR